jgi:hypothetical protein
LNRNRGARLINGSAPTDFNFNKNKEVALDFNKIDGGTLELEPSTVSSPR